MRVLTAVHGVCKTHLVSMLKIGKHKYAVFVHTNTDRHHGKMVTSCAFWEASRISLTPIFIGVNIFTSAYGAVAR